MSHRLAAALAVLCLGAFAPAARAAEEALSPYVTVQRAFLREDFEQVTVLAQQFILQHPTEPEVPRVWLWLALSLDRMQQPHEALRELGRLQARLTARDPLWAEVLFWDGEISRRVQHVDRSRAGYEQLIDKFPDSAWTAQAEMGLGLLDLQAGDFEAAAGHFRTVAARKPESVITRNAARFEGLCYLRLKKFAEAVSAFEALLPKLQGDQAAQAAFYLGESFSGLSKYEEALQAYKRALAGTADAQWSLPAQFGIAWAQYRLERCEDSQASFEAYLAKAAEHRPEALFAQGSCLLQLERPEDAFRRFDEIVHKHPAHPLAFESLLIVTAAHRRDERFTQAKELLHDFLARATDPVMKAQIQLQLGAVALEQGNAAQATTIFTAATEVDHAAVRDGARNGLGDVALHLGDTDAARAQYRQVADGGSDSAAVDYAWYQLGRLDLQRGAYDEAANAFERLVDKKDTAMAADARLALLVTRLNQKQTAEARALLEAIRNDPGSDARLVARAAYYEALMALAEQDEARVRQLCEELLQRAPASDEAFEARLLLADLRAKSGPVEEVVKELTQAFDGERMPRAHRAKLAKRLGDLARSQGAVPQAIRWYERSAELLPSLASEAAYRIATCHEEAGRTDEAITWYRKVERAPWRVRGQLAAAKLLERDERAAEALAIYEMLSTEAIPEAKLVQERLAALREAVQQPRTP